MLRQSTHASASQCLMTVVRTRSVRVVECRWRCVKSKPLAGVPHISSGCTQQQTPVVRHPQRETAAKFWCCAAKPIRYSVPALLCSQQNLTADHIHVKESTPHSFLLHQHRWTGLQCQTAPPPGCWSSAVQLCTCPAPGVSHWLVGGLRLLICNLNDSSSAHPFLLVFHITRISLVSPVRAKWTCRAASIQTCELALTLGRGTILCRSHVGCWLRVQVWRYHYVRH